MSRVFFISSNTTVDPYPVYPLGMAVVCGALIAAGQEVRQYDCLALGMEPLREQIDAFAPDVIGISLRNIDNVDSFCGEDGWYLARTRELVRQLRSYSSAPIVVGGPALTIMPETIADYLGVDHALIGEGEVSFPALVEDLAAGRSVAKIIERQAPLGGADFGSPCYVPEFVEFYSEKSGMLNFQTKRGCPFQCSYCSYPHLEGHSYRKREPRTIVDELVALKQQHGVDKVFFTDSVFNDPKGDYLELVEELIRRDIGMGWAAFFRPQELGRQELELMKRSGLYALELGSDAASDRTLAGINKKLTFAEILKVNEACWEARLPAAHYIMFGGPGETAETLEEGLQNIEALGRAVVFGFSGIRIHPNAPLEQLAIEQGVIDAETSLLKPVYYFSPEIDRDWMNQRITESFAGRMDRIFPPSAGLEKMREMKALGFRGLMWDRIVRFPRKLKRAGI